MKRITQALFAASLLVGAACTPSMAADDDKFMAMAKGTAWFPVRVASVAAGCVFGTPVAMTRRTAVRIRTINEQSADKIGGHEHFPPNLFAAFFSVPAGTLIGVAEGAYYGPKNAISQCMEHPFSKDTFTMGDSYDADGK